MKCLENAYSPRTNKISLCGRKAKYEVRYTLSPGWVKNMCPTHAKTYRHPMYRYTTAFRKLEGGEG